MRALREVSSEEVRLIQRVCLYIDIVSNSEVKASEMSKGHWLRFEVPLPIPEGFEQSFSPYSPLGILRAALDHLGYPSSGRLSKRALGNLHRFLGELFNQALGSESAEVGNPYADLEVLRSMVRRVQKKRQRNWN